MTTNQIVIGAVVLAIIAGGVYYFSANSGGVMEKSDSMQKDKGAMMDEKDEGAMMPKEEGAMNNENNDGAMMQKGSYEAYAPEKLAKASSGDVVLFFRASWCPTCKAVDADIRAHLSAIPTGLTILDVDYDNSFELKKKYGVTYQHTFVQVKADGTLIKKWAGSPTLATLVSEVQ